MEIREADNRMLRRRLIRHVPQPGIDITCGPFALAGRDGDGLFARHHVAAGENPRMPGHHIRTNNDRAIRREGDTGHLPEKSAIGLLAERQHNRICLERFKLPGRLRLAVRIQCHHLNGEVGAGDLFDRTQPFDFDTFLDRLVGLEAMRWHMRPVAPVDDQRLFGTETPGSSRRIHRRVAAAIDHNPATEQRRLASSRVM